MPAAAFVRLMPLADLRVGEPRCAEAGGHRILLCNTGDGVHAVASLCTHAAAPLDEAKLRGHRLTCLLHGASFDVRNGAVLGGRAHEPLKTYATRVVDDQVEVLVEAVP